MQGFTISLGEALIIGKDVRKKAVKKHAALGVSFAIQIPRENPILREEARNRKPKEKRKAPIIIVRKRRMVRDTA